MTEILLELHEAQLLKLLQSFFGKDRVMPHLSVRMICAEFTSDIESVCPASVAAERCLFTIIDEQSVPHLVLEFMPDRKLAIEVESLTRVEQIRSCLSAVGVRYLHFELEEFQELLDPDSGLSLVRLLQAKIDTEMETGGTCQEGAE